jgi:hypothetical protein
MKTWFDYFDTDPFELIGRYIEDSLSSKKILRMQRIDWEYVDWLAEVEGCNMVGFLKDNDAVYRPEDGDYDDFIIGCVKTAYLRREKMGLPRPVWCPAADPHELFDID